MGQRRQNLQDALGRLSKKVGVECLSPVYDTAPVGNTEQPRFLNMVCAVNMELLPAELLKWVKGIEAEMGRESGPPNSPRPIDIDILFYGSQVISTPGLIVPHPRLAERVFVLMPLADIAPDLKHPVTGQTVREMLGKLHWTAKDIIRLRRDDVRNIVNR